MKKIILFLILFSPLSSLALCYQATGYGTGDQNGEYEDLGITQYSYPVYKHATTTRYLARCDIVATNDGWCLSNDYDTFNASTIFYYNFAIASLGVEETGWTNAGASGASPVGTVPVINCTGSSTPETATSTGIFISNLADLSFGIAIIIGLLSFALVGFVWNNINEKRKKW